MKITSVKQQDKLRDRYSIFVDGKYAFSLSESALLEQKLAGDQEIDKNKLREYKKLSKDDRAYGRALNYVALRPRSGWEVQSYLKRKEVEASVIKKIVAKLSKVGLLNDLVFARVWVDNRRLLKPVSKRRLIQELKKKGVEKEIIDQVMTEDSADEHQVLREVLTKKRQQRKYKDNDLKLMQYLARQGFNYEDIKSALNKDLELNI